MGCFALAQQAQNTPHLTLLEVCLKKRYLLDYLFLIGLAGVIVSLDQWTKWLVRTKLASAEMWAPWNWLLPYARIVNWHNTGIAFGLFQNMNMIFAALSILVSLGIFYYFPQVPLNDWLVRIILGVLLGGAVGNLIDRLVQGFVTDFVSVGNFPVFNVADSSISVGVTVLIVGMWIREYKEKRLAEQKAVEAQALEPETPAPAEEDSNG